MKPTEKAEWRHYAALCAVTLAAYANSFGLGLVLDATRLVGEDTRVHAATAKNLGLILNLPYWAPHAQDRLYRPLTTLSFLVNYVFLGSGGNPLGYHVVNFLLHAGNVLLLFALAQRLLRDRTAAFCAAALWAVHPVTTESVANIAGRADLLAGMCLLAALVVYSGAAARPLALGALCLAGCLSKESAAVLPALLLLWDITTERKPRWRDYAAVGLALAAAFWMRERAFAAQPWPEMPFLDNPLRGMGFWTARLTAVKVLGMELALLVWPRNLAFDHSYNQIAPAGWRDLGVWISLAVMVQIVALVWLRRKRDPAPFFAAGFCGLALLPSANLLVLIGSIMAVRFLYLPAAALGLAAAALAFRTIDRRMAGVLMGVAVAALAARTLARNPAWDSNLALASADVKAAPASFRVHGVLATGLVVQNREGNLDAALREAEASWAIVESLPDEWNSDRPAEALSVLCRKKGDAMGGPQAPAGRAWYERAFDLAQRAAGLAAVRRKLFDEDQLRHGMPLPVLAGYEDVYGNLGILDYALERDREAVEAYRMALVEAPDRRDIYNDLLLVYARLNDRQGMARTAIEKVLMFGVTEETLEGVGMTFRNLPGGACALQRSGETVKVDYDCAPVRSTLCAAATEMEGIFTAGRRSRNVHEVETVVAAKGCPQPAP